MSKTDTAHATDTALIEASKGLESDIFSELAKAYGCLLD
jgi:hypothetical protein